MSEEGNQQKVCTFKRSRGRASAIRKRRQPSSDGGESLTVEVVLQ